MALNKAQRERLPSTLARSPKKAQETYIHTLESAEETHGDGEAAHRIALSALKHSFAKVGDHWEPKKRKGPSDEQAAKSGTAARKRPAATAGGVDANASKATLHGHGQTARRQGSLDDEQGRARRGDRQGQPLVQRQIAAQRKQVAPSYTPRLMVIEAVSATRCVVPLAEPAAPRQRGGQGA